MREIKFRVWDKLEKKMYKPFGFADLYGYEGECNAVNVEPSGAGDNDGEHFTLVSHDNDVRDGAINYLYPSIATSNGVSKDLIIMQYTGLKDKNDKEIYEGDIVKTQTDEMLQVIFWCGGFTLTTGKSGDTPTLAYSQPVLEIVGNLYETPNLIKGE